MITFTEDLAYSQAKEADELIKKGVYLGIALMPLCLWSNLFYFPGKLCFNYLNNII